MVLQNSMEMVVVLYKFTIFTKKKYDTKWSDTTYYWPHVCW